MKTLLPSLKEKKRYIVFEVIAKEQLNYPEISKTLKEQALHQLGLIQSAKAGLMVLDERWNPKTQRGVLKVNRKYADAMKAVLCLTKRINNQETIIRSIIVSGSLKKAAKYIDNKGGN